MKYITFYSPHRQKHFEFFNGMNHPHFNITANVDVTTLLPYLKDNKLPVTFSLVYLISRAANEIPELKWRIRGNQVVEHAVVHPSFTVSTEEADVFSFCTVNYDPSAASFIQQAEKVSKAMHIAPSIEDEDGRDDFLFLSAFPWVSFTGLQHAMHYHPGDSIPRITWGKFIEQNNRTLMPLSLQAHHAVVDGTHVGKYYRQLEEMAANPSAFFV